MDTPRSKNDYMRTISSCFICFLIVMLIGFSSFSIARAQEEVYWIEYNDVFGDLRRPVVEFPHDYHIEVLEDIGCGACHHLPDPDTGKLVYMEDEEVGCVECHEAKAQGGSPALREAFHGSCTGCHRQMKKSKYRSGGPTTCGECHNAE